MIKTLLFGIAFVAISAAPAHAGLIADFQLNGDLTDPLGGPDLVGNGGSLGVSGYSFGPDEGLTYNGLSNFSVYTIDIRFSFDSLSSFRKIIDFKDLGSDNGVYNLDTALNFFPFTTSAPGVFVEGELADLRFTRNAAGLSQGFVNGVLLNSFVDTFGDAVATNALNFFIDDLVVAGEASSGFVDSIQIYDHASTVPEPASWAMLIAGFGLVGAAMRRRAANAQAA